MRPGAEVLTARSGNDLIWILNKGKQRRKKTCRFFYLMWWSTTYAA
jgi:hypothetical protein